MKFNWLASIIAMAAFAVFLFLFIWQKRRGRSKAAIRFSNVDHLQTSGTSWRAKYRWILDALRILSLIALLIAFARPQRGLETVRTAREGIAIQMVIDRSSSMTEPLTFKGVEMNRLGVVKKVFAEFILGNNDTLKGRPNDMIGLTSFAGFVEENAPLTLDHVTLVNFAKTIQPAVRIEDGTMIGDAIYFSTLRLISIDELLKKAGQKDSPYHIRSKIIILLTDGQQTRGGMDPLEAAKVAKSNNIKIYTIAITSDDKYQSRDTMFGRFFSLMNNHLDTRLLEQVAATTGGMFAKASSGEDLEKIYQEIDQMEKSRFEERFTTYKEQFPLFVFIGFGLFFLEILLANTLFRKIP